MSSVAIYSLKGGVGKSTLAVNLAHASAATSARKTLLWDIDAQGASSFILGRDQGPAEAARIFSKDLKPNPLAVATGYLQLDLLAADASLRQLDVQLVGEDAKKRLRKLIRALEADYDRIVIDCPPGLTEISEQIFRAADLIVVPISPSPLAVRTYEEVIAHLRGRYRGAVEVLPVLSMVDRRRKLHREAVCAHPDWLAIPQASVVERMALERAPLAEFAAGHPARAAFAELWAQVERKLLAIEAKASLAAVPAL